MARRFAILKIAENNYANAGSQETSIARSLVDLLPPSGKEELVNALGHLTSHSLPLGSPSLARSCDAKSHFLYRARGEYQNVAF